MASNDDGDSNEEGASSEDGLATLSWLLIVAAVAGLAALAVVLVYYFVEDTGDRFVAPNPRRTAAAAMAADVELSAKGAEATDFSTWAEWEQHFKGKCARIEITTGDERITIGTNEFRGPTGGVDFDAAAETIAKAAVSLNPTSTQAQVNCTVN